MKRLALVVPLVVFIALAIFLAVGLTRDPREIPSPLIGKAAPAFRLGRLQEPTLDFGPEQMKGKVWMLNVWASWCVSCRAEHPILVEFSKRNEVPIVGLNWKDNREDGLKWLDRFGNPYAFSVFDGDGRVGINYGVYGAPETFVIDRDGVIRYKQIGPVTAEALEERCHLTAQRMSVLYGLESPEFFDKSLFRNFIELLRRRDVIQLSDDQRLLFGAPLIGVAADAQLVLSEQIRHSILQVTLEH